MIIKFILIIFFLCVAAYLMRANLGAKQTAWVRLCMLGFCLLAVVTVAVPQVTTKVANLVGVGRGADLLMYLLVLVFLFAQLTSAKHRNEQERRITKIARAVAINQALINQGQTTAEDPEN